MLMPSIFRNNEDFLSDFNDFDPWFGDREMRDLEKKLYGHHAKNMMNTDVRESEDAYNLEIDLPGFSKDEIKAELNNGYLTITAEKNVDVNEDKDQEGKKGHYIRRERYSGSCQRSFYVGTAVRQEDIKANFKHGMLELSIPKKEVEQKNNYIAIEG